MLPHNPTSYQDLEQRFRWEIPARFNIGVACSDAIAANRPDEPAIIDYSSAIPQALTFQELAESSSRFASALQNIGIERGDRVAVMQPQSHEAVIAHLGIYKLGAIAVPLATQFGPIAIAHRLENAQAKALVTNQAGISRFDQIRDEIENPIIKISTDYGIGAAHLFSDLIEQAQPGFEPADTRPDDPAMMLFTSGTTGQPKGALHGHRVLLGHLPGIQSAHGFLPQDGDRFWTPSDWAWAGGLLNVLLPSLYFGVPVVAARAPKFETNWAIDLIERASIRNVFLPPTALKMMQASLTKKHRLDVRTFACAGEALGHRTLTWAEDFLGVKINEFYGQTECNAIIGACHQIDVWRPGSMGKQVPGHQVRLLDDDGNSVGPGEIGEIAIHRDSPVMFLGYHNDPEATKAKLNGDWMMTGDRATCDPLGYFQFLGRNDDIITSAGYRIGPSEIEDCLTGHSAIELAAVVGISDDTRTQVVGAFIKLKPQISASTALENEIKDYVRTRLSAHEYPRRISFVDDIPLTESGKIIRRHFKDA